MASVEKVTITVNVDKSVNDLKDIAEQVGLLVDLVPEWYSMEVAEILTRIAAIVEDMLKVGDG